MKELTKELTFKGDDNYAYDCTGDCCVGDEICFERAVFSGSFKKPKFDGFKIVKAKIIKDSYGRDKQQHTFTLELEDGETTLIKGRNLYKNRVWRKLWKDENKRGKALDEKHFRGSQAREAKEFRQTIMRVKR